MDEREFRCTLPCLGEHGFAEVNANHRHATTVKFDRDTTSTTSGIENETWRVATHKIGLRVHRSSGGSERIESRLICGAYGGVIEGAGKGRR